MRSAWSVISKVPYTALAHQIMTWMDAVQSFVYSCFKKMVQVEPETIVRTELDLNTVEAPVILHNRIEQSEYQRQTLQNHQTKNKNIHHKNELTGKEV